MINSVTKSNELSLDENQTEKSKQRCTLKRKPGYDCIKRIFDVVVAVICLTAGLPVYILISLAIIVDDPGNPFFLQKRIGYKGKEFRIVKFRTMYRNSDKLKEELIDLNDYSDVHFKMEKDPRVTRVGRFLRSFSLDETPQAVNLLIGNMSVIGPRPFIPSEQALLPMDRLCVKPGLSCYWQLADTAKMSSEAQLELDYKYIRERGVKTDLKIIAETFANIIKGGNC